MSVVIPALNEEQSIGTVISAIPRWVDQTIVADNGSTDRTADVARAHGAEVVFEQERGYGAACLRGIDALDDPDVVVFLDGDYSDRPEEMALLVDPIINDSADLVAGSRVLGQREAGALAPQARLGNWLACALIRIFWGAVYTDLGPFRAIRASSLKRLRMRDRNFGWMAEMQIKATREGVRVLEVPVSYRRRIGNSKITGTVSGVVGAGAKILLTIIRLAAQSFYSNRMKEQNECLVILTRYPEPGMVKTRLIPALGIDGAARLHREIAEQTFATARQLQRSRHASVEVRFTGGDNELMGEWLASTLPFKRQGGGDLGARIDRAFGQAFQSGMSRVVVIGTDCPAVTVDLLQQAFDALKRRDVVIGPAKDGGYYLIGLRRQIPELFKGVSWGTGEVMEHTLQKARRLGIFPVFLEALDDIDRPEDLQIWKKKQSGMAS